MRKIFTLLIALAGFIWFLPTNLNAQYCASAATYSGDSEIDNVVLNGNTVNISNSTVGVCAQYTDFTALPAADVFPGGSYTVSVTAGTCGGNYTKGAKVFIDFNGNGDFTDVGEDVGASAASSVTATYAIPFTVPTGANPGVTRMRVIVSETSSPATIGSCASYSYGETEDYSISIMSPYDCDLMAISWDTPLLSSNDLTAAETVMVTVKNVGTLAQSNFNVAYSIDGGTTFVTELVTTSLPANTSYQHTFATPADFSVPGIFDCEFNVSLACDSNTTNDAMQVQVTNASSIATFPYFQNFEAANFWQIGGGGSWAQGIPDANVINSAYSGVNAMVTNLTGNYSSNEYSWVESPFFNMTTLSAPVVEFKMWYETQGSYTDGVALQYTTDGGLTWDHVGIGLGALSGDPNGDNWINTMSIEGLQFYNGWAGNTGGYQTMKYFLYGAGAITDLANEPSVKFRMLFGSNGSTNYNGVAFDDFMVYQNPDNDMRALSVATDPTCIGSVSLTNVYLEVKNEGALAQSAFDVSYSIDGGATFVTESVAQAMNAGDVYTYTFATQADMTAPGIYDLIGVVTLTGDQNNFNDSVPETMEILGGIVADDLESWGPTQTTGSCTAGTLGAFGGGWVQDQTDNGEWRLDVGGTGSSNTGPSVDYNPGTASGKYLYTEASGCYGTTCGLISPCFDFSANAYKIQFAYHMYGQSMGSLSVDVWDGTQWVNDVWMVSGDLGNVWNEAVVGLGAFQNPDAQVRLRGVTGSNYYSDIAIDDIQFIQLLPDDVAVLEMFPTSFCADSIDVFAVVQNMGNNIVSTVDVNWEVNGVAQATNVYTAGLGIGAIDTILLGGYTFVSGTPYDISIWSTNPNGNVDSDPTNDSIAYNGFQTSLSGTYVIGAAGQFTSFVDAVNGLLTYGVCGPVEFVADSGTYVGQLTIPDILGADSINNITFRSATGDSTDVVVEYGATGSTDNWVWMISQDYVTISGITVKSTTTTNYGRVFHLDGTNWSTITNCVITAAENSSSLTSAIYSYNDKSDNNNTISYNDISNGYYGIYFYSNTSTHEFGNKIIGNNLTNYYYYGLYTYYQDGITVNDNYVMQRPSGSTTNYGLYIYQCYASPEVQGNIVYDASGSTFYGIYLYYSDGTATDPGLCANNYVGCEGVTGTVYGLRVYYADNWNIFHNTINITSGSTTNGYACYTYATTSNGSNMVFKNNSFSNTGGGYAFYLNETIFLNLLMVHENNNMYSSGTNLAKLQNVNIPDLAGWQNYYPTNYVSADPGFTSANDPHIGSPALDGQGVPLAEVPYDIDGEMRDAVTPDIGCDEFTPQALDVALTALVAPADMLGYCYGAEENIIVTLANAGLDTLDLSAFPVDVTVSVTGPNPMSSTITVNSGLIAPGNSIDVTVSSTYDMTASGTYTFDAFAFVLGDGNALNDAIGTVAINYINLNSLPFIEDFETFSAGNPGSLNNGWTRDPGSGFAWMPDVSNTGSSSTGPLVDHTTGTTSGTYMYTEASSGSAGSYAHLYPPCGDVADLTVQFWYHMYGATIDSFMVQAMVSNSWVTIWGLQGQQQTASGDDWLQASALIPTAATGIRFTVKRGTSYTGDVCLDDVMIFQPLANDMAVEHIWTLGELPLAAGDGHMVQAIVTNWGYDPAVNLPITLDITGANAFTNTVTIASFPAYSTDTITFGPFTTQAIGWNNLTVSVPNDDNNANNMFAMDNQVTANTFAYADTSGSDGGGGNNSASGHIYWNKHYVNGLKAVTSIEAYITDDANNVGNTVYGALMDANNNLIALTAPHVLAAADANTYITLTFLDPSLTVLANTEFYAGFAEEGPVAGNYFPIGYQDEDPYRPGTYFRSSNINGSGFSAYTNQRRWMIKANVDDPTPWDALMIGTVAPMGGCGLAMETVTVEMLNNGSDTITSVDLSYQVTGGAAVTETATTYLIPGDILTYSFTTQYDFSVVGVDSIFGITSWATLAGDTLNANDTAYNEIEAMFVPVDPIPEVSTVVFGNSGAVSVWSDYNVVWYDDPSATNFVAMGDTFYNTPVLFDTTSYWAVATSSSEGDFTIGTGANNNTGTSCNPFGQFYTSNQSQFIYLASDLAAAGIMPGNVNALSLNCITPTNATSLGYNMDNFNIEMGHTTASVMSTGNWMTGLTSVYAAPNWVSTAGWNYYEFQNTFVWNGVDNIMVQFCFSNYYGSGSYSSNGVLAGDNMPYTVGAGNYTDGAFTCGQTPNLTTAWRPQIILNATVPGCESNLVEVIAEVTNIPDYDAGIGAINSPMSGIEMTMETVCVDIINLGTNPITGFPIVYELTGAANTLVTEIVTATINPGDVYTYCFGVPADLSVYGTYNLCVYTQYTNDGYAANDTLCTVVTNDPLQYCPSNATSTAYEEIVSVTVGSFTNASPATGTGYTDYTSLSTLTMSPGMTYPISVTGGYAPGYSGNYNCYFEVYIDWNHDGIWDETTDELVFGAQGQSATTVSGTFTVPITAVPGNHGMRVVMEETTGGANVFPCGTYLWGETEDYFISVSEPQAWDAATTSILLPDQTATLYENDPSGVEVVVFNVGDSTITSMDVIYTIDGMNPVVFPWTGTLMSFESDTIVFPSMLIPGGYFDLCAYTMLANDTNYINDTTCWQYYALPQYDLELSAIIAPESGCDYGMETVTIEITNLGDTVIGGVTVGYFTNTMAMPTTEVIADTIPQGGTFVYTFATPVDLAVTADTDFDFTAYLEYGPDPVQANDTLMEVVGSYISPADPIANGVTIWSSEMATLTVTNPDTAMNYNWYNPDTTLYSIGDTMVSPQLFDTTTYFLEAAFGGGAGALMTPMNSNNGQSGNMFNVTALSGNITIESFDVNFDNTTTVSVYYRAGGFVGAETNQSAWTFLGEVQNLVSNGVNVPTPLAVGGLTIPVNETYGIWITTANTSINYTTLTAPPNWTDGNLLIDATVGVSLPLGSVFNPRGWNGTIYYTSGNGCGSNLVPVQVAVQYADYDAGVVEILSPITGPYMTLEDVTCVIYNNGLNALTGFPVYYELDGLPQVVETFTGTIFPGDSAVFTFAVQADVTGYTMHDICVGTLVPNDGYTSNDEMCAQFVNQDGTGLVCDESFPYITINDPAVLSATTFAYDAEWWKFVVPVPYENVLISLCGSSFNTQLQYYDSCGGPVLASNNNSCGNQSEIAVGGIVDAGTYYVRVYGNSSDFGDFILNITGDQVPKFEIIETIFDVECNGALTGSVTTTIGPGAGGTVAALPMTYAWYDANNNLLGTSADAFNLPAGEVTIVATDNTGWEETETYVLTEPTAVVVTGVATDATTYGGADGAVDITVSGGTTPYMYAWPLGFTTEDVTALTAGVYVVTVTDDNGCILEASYPVNSPLPAPVWNVATTNVAHDIVVPMNASVTLDGNMVDPGSLIGVFYDSVGVQVCGGYAFFTPGVEAVVVAYGTDPGVDNGFTPGETFTWKVWDAGETDPYVGVADYNTTFYPNSSNFQIAGLSGVYAINAASIITQTVTLPAGWSIWSTYIDPLDPDIAMVMADITAPCFTQGTLEIVKNGAGQIFWPFYCLNTIGDVVIGEGYQAKTNGTLPAPFGVTGLQIYPEITPFIIPSGWSILGYLRTSPADISVMLSPLTAACFTPGCLEIAKNGAGQIFWPFYCLNTIGNMNPGEGYQIKLNCAPPSFLYPANAASTKSNIMIQNTPQNYGVVEPSGDNMTIGIPKDAWSIAPEVGDEVAVFNANNGLIGSTVYEGDFTALTVWGKEVLKEEDKGSNGQVVSMRLWHYATATEEEIIVEKWQQGSDEYVTNAISIVGKLSLSGEEGVNFVLGQNMPNPYTGSTRIPFYLPETCDVTIAVYNTLGELVEELISETREAGSHVVEFDGSRLEAGNYFYKLVSDKYTATKPMSIK